MGTHYYITDDNVWWVECTKIDSGSADAEIFKVEKYDRYSSITDKVFISFNRTFLSCHLNTMGGSPSANSRLEARRISELEQYRYAMRASNLLEQEKGNGINISDANFKKLVGEERDIDSIIYRIKKLTWRLFRNVPHALLSPDDIFISTDFDFGEIQLRLMDMARDGYIKKFNSDIYEKDSEGFRRLDQELKEVIVRDIKIFGDVHKMINVEGNYFEISDTQGREDLIRNLMGQLDTPDIDKKIEEAEAELKSFSTEQLKFLEVQFKSIVEKIFKEKQKEVGFFEKVKSFSQRFSESAFSGVIGNAIWYIIQKSALPSG